MRKEQEGERQGKTAIPLAKEQQSTSSFPFEEGVHEVSEVEMLAREAAILNERFRDRGFQRGVLEARQDRLQEGFDRGYHLGCLESFCRAFLKEASEAIQIESDILSLPSMEGNFETINNLHRQIDQALIAIQD